MANNTTKQTKNTHENIKNVKNTLVALDKVQKSLSALRQKVSSIQVEIAQREEFLAAPVVEVAPVQTKPVETKVVETKPVVEVKAEAKPEVVESKPAVEEKPADTKSDKPAKQAKEQKEASKPVVENKPAKEAKPATPEVVSTKENGREVKTYTDEKGNKLVRKFWDPSAQKKPAAPQQRPAQQGQGGDRRNSVRPEQQQRGERGQQPKQRFDKNEGNNAQQRTPAAKKPAAAPTFASPIPTKQNDQKSFGNKNKTHEKHDEKRAPSKKSLITKNFDNADYDEDKVVRRAKTPKKQEKVVVQAPKITHAVVTTSEVPIKVLSEKIGVSVSEIIKQLFKESIFKTINDSIDFDYASYIASMYDITLELKAEKSAEEIIAEAFEDDGMEDDTKRPPIVTVMGHVDHGKTSLLDAIRNTRVTSGEAGGITQHIGAYTVQINGESITFIDTPGHAAFTSMRARGAKVTDVAIIVVAADDGVMPQTIEAINHAKAAEVSIIVAMNKMDKTDINPDRVKQQLAEHGLLVEEWGGDTILVPVSAKAGMGINDLLEAVLLVTEIKELKANPKKRAMGSVLEAKLDKGRGPVATVLVLNGTLNIGDNVIAGFATGKIRAMFDDKGRRVKQAGPSTPVEVLGFSEVPQAGDFVHAADEKLVKKAAEERKDKVKIETANKATSMNLNDLFGKISEGNLKNLNLIIKTDVQGSLEALRSSLEKISNEEVKVSAIHGGVGAINETDIMLARASNAIVIGFNVRADSNAKVVAEKEGVDIRLYNVIYDAVDDVTKAMKGMLTPKFKESIVGSIEVREVFKISGVGAVAGAYVTSGKAVRNGKVRVYRNDVCVYDGNILALKRFKDDVKEVATGYECGVSVENYNDIKVGDIFEIYQMEEIEQ